MMSYNPLFNSLLERFCDGNFSENTFVRQLRELLLYSQAVICNNSKPITKYEQLKLLYEDKKPQQNNKIHRYIPNNFEFIFVSADLRKIKYFRRDS